MIVQNITCTDLEKGKTYNVLAICDWGKEQRKYYLADKASWSYRIITPYDASDFDIINWTIPRFWFYGKDYKWNITIWPKEIIETEWFWEKYYDGDTVVRNIIEFYHQIAAQELFND